MQNLEDLKSTIQTEISKLDDTNSWERLKKNALQGKLKSLEKDEKASAIEKRKLVFVGTIGTGKTTTICHLFNLLDEVQVEKRDRRKKDSPSRTITESKPIMTTGSGGTTISEIRLVSHIDEASFFEIEFFSIEEVNKLVEDLGQSIYFKERPPENREFAIGGSPLTREIERALRNMLGIPLSKNADEARILLQDIESLVDYTNLLKSRLAVTVSEKKIHPYPLILNSEAEKNWIREEFMKINVANIPGFSIPKTITLHIRQEILGDRNTLSRFESIVDTKGLDSPRDRKDIDTHLSDEKTICILTSRFADAPDTNILSLVKKHEQHGQSKASQRMVLLVMVRDSEAENKIGSNGLPVDDWEEGVAIAKNEILAAFQQESIQFPEENILFFDPLKFYSEGLPKGDDWEYINGEIETVIKEIENVIEKQKIAGDVLEKYRIDFEAIQDALPSENALLAIENLKHHLEALPAMIVSDDFDSAFCEKYLTDIPHWITKNALNRRGGIWESRNFDLSYSGGALAFPLSATEFAKNYTSVKKLIDHESRNAKTPLFESIYLKLQSLSQDFVLTISSQLELRLKTSELKIDNTNGDVWDELISEWGGGSGYTERVVDIFKEHLRPINTFFRDAVEKEWYETVIAGLIQFLGADPHPFVSQKDLYEQEPIYLDSFRIHNYFSIEDTEVINGLGHNREIYFLGENGDGKSILLQALAWTLKGDRSPEKEIGKVIETLNENVLFQRNKGQGDAIFWAKDTRNIEYHGDNRGYAYPFLYAYGINRLRFKGLPSISLDKEVYISLFDSNFNLEDPVEWINKIRLERLDPGEDSTFGTKLFLSKVEEFLQSLLESEVKIQAKGSEVYFEERGTKGLKFSQLSEGYKSSLIWLMDLLTRLSRSQKVENISDFKGIVIVDEVGIFLHPTLKYSFVKKLREKLPNIQWIFTTHSPEIILGADPAAAIFKLYKEPETGVTKIIRPFEGEHHFTANTLLTSLLWRMNEFTTRGMPIDQVSSDDYIYQKIHEKISQQIQDVPNLVDQKIEDMIEAELNKLD